MPDVGPDGEISLWFWHWFAFSYASGTVQVQTLDEATGLWSSSWDSVGGPYVGSSAVWTEPQVPLSAYAGRTVRIGFLHKADSYHTAPGWYIDVVEIRCNYDPCQPLEPPDDLTATYRRKSVNLIWDPSEGATSYVVYRKLDTETLFSEIGETDETTYTDRPPTGTRYADYYVVAVNDCGVSDPSDVVRVRIIKKPN